MMNRRRFLSTTAAATAGLAAGLPTRSYAQKSANDTINVAVIGIRGDNAGHPTWTARGRGQDHYEHFRRFRTSGSATSWTSTNGSSPRRCRS